ncbi:MAG: hypothetical protein ISS65_05370 [Desulfobacterales bacterium]|uniref:Rhodanese domain-containing protein n=1 Tax=Candidatus Desulfatibia profunda TaxID=2841695 RepID=A0A8J6NP25_9BACT|nr:hypothetical protein [Candidatus Desulfatibia profunda]MBL7179623.1 hypothetical protein [Desulfobacterales bacterium]
MPRSCCGAVPTNVRPVSEKLIEYGYTNVWTYKDGIVGWIKAGLPVCNQFTGLFQVTEYSKEFAEMDKDGKPKW